MRIHGLAISSGMVLGGCFLLLGEDEIQLDKLPPAAETTIVFEEHIEPILKTNCLRCHGPERPKSDFRLDIREEALTGGDYGPDIISGDSLNSPLIHFIARLEEDYEMPPVGKGDPLTNEEIGLMRAWIDQGVVWSATEGSILDSGPQFKFEGSLRFINVDGDRDRFRQNQWMEDGPGLRIDEFFYREKKGKDGSIRIEGRMAVPEETYRTEIIYEQRDRWHLRFGFDQFRKFYDDSGGFYDLFAVPSYDLNRDLELDNGRTWIEIGLDRPDLPKAKAGYEFRYRDGRKSTLQWGSVTGAGPNKKIYPSYKDIDETVHLLKLDVDYEVSGFRIEDHFVAEFYDINTERTNILVQQEGKASPDKGITVSDDHDHLRVTNTLWGEKQIRDWFYVSTGYSYNYMDGEASFNSNTFLTGNAGTVPTTGFDFDDRFWTSNEIILEQYTHTYNANAMVGPWKGLSFSGGVQSEWLSQDGFGSLNLDEGDPAVGLFLAPARIDADLNKFSVEELFEVRLTSIPYTTLYAETRFRQETYDQFETESIDGFQSFLRDTDADTDLKYYRAGFSTSPWRRINWQTSLSHSKKQNNYDHLRKESDVGFPLEGYSAFIETRDINEDKINTKLVFRPASWLKTVLQYELKSTEFHTRTGEVGGGRISSGGRIFSGNYDANIYSFGFYLTPWKRVIVNGSFSLQDIRSVAFDNQSDIVAPYKGDVYSLRTTVLYRLDDQTKFSGTYGFSRSDFAQDEAESGLPLGIRYDWHVLQAGIQRQFNTNVEAGLFYGMYLYDEQSSDGINNYTAHGVFTTLSLNLN